LKTSTVDFWSTSSSLRRGEAAVACLLVDWRWRHERRAISRRWWRRWAERK
jgi:hypothetical protein